MQNLIFDDDPLYILQTLSLWCTVILAGFSSRFDFFAERIDEIAERKEQKFSNYLNGKTPTIQFALTTAFDARYTLHTQREKHSEIHKR